MQVCGLNKALDNDTCVTSISFLHVDDTISCHNLIKLPWQKIMSVLGDFDWNSM